MPCFSYYLLCFFFNKVREGLNRFCLEVGREEVTQIMYTHVSKRKNDKIKILKTNKSPIKENIMCPETKSSCLPLKKSLYTIGSTVNYCIQY
jgi:hypothetical protein